MGSSLALYVSSLPRSHIALLAADPAQAGRWTRARTPSALQVPLDIRHYQPSYSVSYCITFQLTFQTQTLLNSLQPSPNTPIYLIPHTILASLPHRNRITPFLQLGSRGFHIIHIVLSSSTEVKVARLLAGRRGSADSIASAAGGGANESNAPARGEGNAGQNGSATASHGSDQSGVLGDTMGRITDEASLLELRMEDEVLRLMSGIIGRRASAPDSGRHPAFASASAFGTANTSSSSASSSAQSQASDTNTIKDVERYLSAEYEIDTSRLDAALTGMMAAEYVMDVMRRDGVLLAGGRKRSC